MTFSSINNTARFHQKIDFATFCSSSVTDIDAIHDFMGKMWLVLEAKTAGAEINLGQHYTLQNLVKALGMTRPTFAVVAQHDTRSSEAITGDNMFVSTIYSSGPRVVGKVVIHHYENDDKPTYNEILSHLMLLSEVDEKHRKHVELGGDMQALLDSGVFDTEPPVAVYDMAIKRPDMLQKLAQLDFVDWSNFDAEMEAWLVSLGVNSNNVQKFVEHVFYRWVIASETLH